MSSQPTIVIVPGWRDSGPGHWQSLWADALPGAVRVVQDDWITPVRTAWVASIARTILAQPGPVVVEVDMQAWGPFAVKFAGPPKKKED